MSSRKYSDQQAGNIGLGQVGCEFLEAGTAAVSSLVVAIQFLEDSTISTLTPDSASSYMGDESGLGEDVTGTFPQGMVIFGRWTAVELLTGRAIAYLG